jgi:hypothetical protein
MNSGLRLNGKVQRVTEKTYQKEDWSEGMSYTIWVIIEWGKKSIQTQIKPKVTENEYYSFPVGTDPFTFEDKETWEEKTGVGLYLRKDKIESL